MNCTFLSGYHTYSRPALGLDITLTQSSVVDGAAFALAWRKGYVVVRGELGWTLIDDLHRLAAWPDSVAGIWRSECERCLTASGK